MDIELPLRAKHHPSSCSNKQCKVLIVEDHPLFRNALAHLVQSVLGNAPVMAESAEDALEAMAFDASISMIILDVGLPGIRGKEAIQAFRCSWPDIPILVVSGLDGISDAETALNSGAAGYVSKTSTSEELAFAIRSISGVAPYPAQPAPITGRQKEILALLCQGYSNKEIGKRLYLADATVKMHISALFRIFNATSRTQVILAAHNLGIDLQTFGPKKQA